MIMVVENTRDLAAYEKTGKFEGVYHVLHGAISPMLGIGPGDIRLSELIQRLQQDVDAPYVICPEHTKEAWEEYILNNPIVPDEPVDPSDPSSPGEVVDPDEPTEPGLSVVD